MDDHSDDPDDFDTDLRELLEALGVNGALARDLAAQRAPGESARDLIRRILERGKIAPH